jgi:hypothetical protein
MTVVPIKQELSPEQAAAKEADKQLKKERSIAKRKTGETEARRKAKILDEKHFTVWESGKVRLKTITNLRDTKIIKLDDSDPAEIKKLYGNVWVQHECFTQEGGTKSTVSNLGEYWLNYYPHREYDQVVFMPGKAAPDRCFNAWLGWRLVPKQGDWSIMKNHIYENLCEKDDTNFNFFLDWVAAMLQRPWKVANSAIVMRGEEGVGKGIVASAIGHIMKPHYLPAAKKEQVSGRFNEHLRYTIFLFADEAFFAGDREADGVLKTLITETDMSYEGKGKAIYDSTSCLHIMMSTNNDWAIPAGPQARRYFVLDVPKKEHSEGYFNEMKQQMEENGGCEAMMHDLMQRDLSHYNPYKVPKTKALLNQKILGLHMTNPTYAWLYDKLQNGYFFSGLDWNTLIPTEATYRAFCATVSRTGVKWKDSEDSFGKSLRRIFPGNDLMDKKRKKLGNYWKNNRQLLDNPETKNTRIYHYAFGSLSSCRAAFEKVVGQSIMWNNIDDIEIIDKKEDDEI